MTVQGFIDLFSAYGMPIIAAVIFLENMNLPGFPAGVIMPAAGVLVAQSQLSLPLAIVISTAGGLGGCMVIYAICYHGGAPLLHKLFGKSQKFEHFVELAHSRLEAGRGKALFICRLIPVLRTIVSIPAGLLRMPAHDYALWTTLGVAVWNTVLISFGYFFSEAILTSQLLA